jgi:hypothetical protein
VRSILETCRPRADILGGTFNPEIFTASLSQVLDFYRGKKTVIHNLYTGRRRWPSKNSARKPRPCSSA